ncbi:PAQR family membrane homeostasis protein TrhA [Algivirga pacifica]|uniref:Hemolysin III family protein n=1 Tax=Algivirga pacifica TaxID=1162670 RepID=A0ABP9D846_9BACT
MKKNMLTSQLVLEEGELLRRQEERWNSWTHGIAAILSVWGLWMMLDKVDTNNQTALISVCLYGGSMIFVFTASTLLHLYHNHRWTGIFETLDHSGIYLLIAGTYTPFMVLTLGKEGGWTICYLIWGGAILGVLHQATSKKSFKWLSLTVYLLMGWVWLLKADDLTMFLRDGMLILFIGFVLYMVGVLFYIWNKLPYNHAFWHIFVMAGTFSIYLAIYNYVL